MEKYLRYGLVLFAVWIIATKLMSFFFVLLKESSSLDAFLFFYTGLSIITGLLAVVAAIVIFAELRGEGWDMKKVAITSLGLTLMIFGVYYITSYFLINFLMLGMSGAESKTISSWIFYVLGAVSGVTALLIIISLQEEGSVAKTGLFLYSVVTIAGIVFQFFGMEGNTAGVIALDVLGIVSAVLILMRR